MRLKSMLPVIGVVIILLAAGCGASKSYVDDSVAGERARNEANMGPVTKDLADTKAELERLKSLTAQLEQKTEMALNQAKGFEDYQVLATYEIFFDFNSSQITAEAQGFLDKAGDMMITNRSAVMEIAGYCDPTGSAAYNLELGNRRSAAAKYYLVDNFGINLFRLFMVSYGKYKSVESSDGQASYAQQRKVILTIWGKP